MQEVRSLSPFYLAGLREQKSVIEAREAIQLIAALGAAFADSSDFTAKQTRMNLAMEAFPDDDIARATMLEAMTRG